MGSISVHTGLGHGLVRKILAAVTNTPQNRHNEGLICVYIEFHCACSWLEVAFLPLMIAESLASLPIKMAAQVNMAHFLTQLHQNYN